jgi:hypothetical protein
MIRSGFTPPLQLVQGQQTVSGELDFVAAQLKIRLEAGTHERRVVHYHDGFCHWIFSFVAFGHQPDQADQTQLPKLRGYRCHAPARDFKF